jgi:hypothetical protein
MLIGAAWISRASVNTGYLTGIGAPMIIFGVGQGLGLSTLTTGGMAGAAPKDAGVAGGLVKVAHTPAARSDSASSSPSSQSPAPARTTRTNSSPTASPRQ